MLYVLPITQTSKGTKKTIQVNENLSCRLFKIDYVICESSLKFLAQCTNTFIQNNIQSAKKNNYWEKVYQFQIGIFLR